MGNFGAEFRRKFEFQVKSYLPNSKVPYKKIKSSLKLFKLNYTDFIYFIITGQGFDSTAEAEVGKLETTYPNRIRRTPLTEPQENKLYLLALYEEITGKKLGSNRAKDLPVAKKLISYVIGQPVESFLKEVKNLAYRKSELDVDTDIFQGDELLEKIKIQGHKDITTFGEEVTPEEKKPLNFPKWLITYPEFKIYKYEVCALCLWFQNSNREKGKDKLKFFQRTIERNVIDGDASLDKNVFSELVKHMFDNGFTKDEKQSYRLTEKGENLYKLVKKDNYKIQL